MFAQLHDLCKNGNCTVMLSITAQGENIAVRVTPIPTNKDASAALFQPLDLVSLPAELDAEFVGIVASYSGQRKSLQQSLDDATTLMKAAAKEATKQSVEAVSKTAVAAKPVKADATPTQVEVEKAPSAPEADTQTLELF